jgi:hypothetical protein
MTAGGSVARERDEEVRVRAVRRGAVAACARPRREGVEAGSECDEAGTIDEARSETTCGEVFATGLDDAVVGNPTNSRAPTASVTRSSNLIERVRPPCGLNGTDGTRFWAFVQ